MEKQVKIGDRTYTVKEIRYKDVIALGTTDQGLIARKMLQLSAGVTDEEFDALSMRDGVALTQAVNEVNGLDENFQQTLQGSKTK
jgi:hypothetical protein